MITCMNYALEANKRYEFSIATKIIMLLSYIFLSRKHKRLQEKK